MQEYSSIDGYPPNKIVTAYVAGIKNGNVHRLSLIVFGA